MSETKKSDLSSSPELPKAKTVLSRRERSAAVLKSCATVLKKGLPAVLVLLFVAGTISGVVVGFKSCSSKLDEWAQIAGENWRERCLSASGTIENVIKVELVEGGFVIYHLVENSEVHETILSDRQGWIRRVLLDTPPDKPVYVEKKTEFSAESGCEAEATLHLRSTKDIQ